MNAHTHRKIKSTRSFLRLHGRIVVALLLAVAALVVGDPAARVAGAAGWSNNIVAIAGRPGGGYWSVTQTGAVRAGDGAPSYGDVANKALARPIVGITATASGHGYWLVASDGGIFGFGDAHFYGSTGAIHLNRPIVGIAATATGHGYWLVASDGGIFGFGDAHFYGSAKGVAISAAGIARTADGDGYWIVDTYAGPFPYGTALTGVIDPPRAPNIVFPEYAHVKFGYYPIPASLPLPTAGTFDDAVLRSDNGNGWNQWGRAYTSTPTGAQRTAMMTAVHAAVTHAGWTISYASANQLTIEGADGLQHYEGYVLVPSTNDFFNTAWQLTLWPANSRPWSQWQRPAALAKPAAWGTELLQRVNSLRAARGLHALQWCPTIAMADQLQVQDMVRRSYPAFLWGSFPIAHMWQELDGNQSERESLFGNSASSEGIRLWVTNVGDVVDQWAASSTQQGARSGIFNPDITVIGAGVAEAAPGAAGRVWAGELGYTTDECS